MALDISKIPLSPCIVANGFILLSGQLGFSEPGVLVDGGIKEQTQQAIKNIEAVLKPHGADLSHVVKTTIWLTDASDFPLFNEIYAACFSGHPYPARSTVVSSLLIPGAKVEIEAIARLEPS